MLLNPAGHDAAEMLKLRRKVDGDAMVAHPAPHANPDGGNLLFLAGRLNHPQAHTALPAFGRNVELLQGADNPFLQVADIAPKVRLGIPCRKVEHHITDALAGAMIGELATPSG